jgi:hypothetical protein
VMCDIYRKKILWKYFIFWFSKGLWQAVACSSLLSEVYLIYTTFRELIYHSAIILQRGESPFWRQRRLSQR